MGVKYLSYKDLSVGRRNRAGRQALIELRRSMALPGLSDDQRQEIEAGAAKMAAWMAGTLETTAPEVPHCERPAESPPQPPGQHFEIVVTEGLSVDDGLG